MLDRTEVELAAAGTLPKPALSYVVALEFGGEYAPVLSMALCQCVYDVRVNGHSALLHVLRWRVGLIYRHC